MTEWFQLPKYGGGEFKFAVLPADPLQDFKKVLLGLLVVKIINIKESGIMPPNT